MRLDEGESILLAAYTKLEPAAEVIPRKGNAAYFVDRYVESRAVVLNVTQASVGKAKRAWLAVSEAGEPPDRCADRGHQRAF